MHVVIGGKMAHAIWADNRNYMFRNHQRDTAMNPLIQPNCAPLTHSENHNDQNELLLDFLVEFTELIVVHSHKLIEQSESSRRRDVQLHLQGPRGLAQPNASLSILIITLELLSQLCHPVDE